MSEQPYSLIDRLSGEADSRFGKASGEGILNAIMLLSAILSGIFFFKNSKLVFEGVWEPAAIVLGLLVGLVPAEGAFFGWRMIRQTKRDMTDKQVKTTGRGITFSTVSAIFSTFALYVSSFQYVPAEIKAYDDWFVFVALAVPIMVQVGLFAHFTTNERTVVENNERAKLGAMGFDAYIQSERARIMSVIRGQERELNQLLESYGRRVGKQEAERLLGDGNQELLNMGNRRESERRETPAPAGHAPLLPDVDEVHPFALTAGLLDALGRDGRVTVAESDNLDELIDLASSRHMRNALYIQPYRIKDRRTGNTVWQSDKPEASAKVQVAPASNGHSTAPFE